MTKDKSHTPATSKQPATSKDKSTINPDKAASAPAKAQKIKASGSAAPSSPGKPVQNPEATSAANPVARTQPSETAKPTAAPKPPAPPKKATPAGSHSHAKAPAQSPSFKTKGNAKKTDNKLIALLKLMRLDKPIGILLLLWPTLWSLWLAARGIPNTQNLVIFGLGVIVMRSAGCVINDFADRKIDGRVKRTASRPLATGAISPREAILLFVCLCLIAFALVLFTNPLTIKLSVGGLLLAFTYPFMKRHTHLPQVVLGAAFAWGIPMAFAAEAGVINKNMWLIYFAVVLWTVVYDTFYAMVDRDDDIKIGVKSTAILFGEQDRLITATLQVMVLGSLVLIGKGFNLGWIFYASIAVAAALFSYQQVLIRYREHSACFKAFLNNNWVGAVIFAGIAGDFAFK